MNKIKIINILRSLLKFLCACPQLIADKFGQLICFVGDLLNLQTHLTQTQTIMGIECELPPLRSLDDFLLGSARFQMPNVQDFDKWGNRVTKNLLYYQTNYFVMAIIVSSLFVFFNPIQTISGICAFVIIIAAFVVINPNRIQGQPQHDKFPGSTGWMYLGGIIFTITLVLYLFQSIMYVMLLVLLPFVLAFIHASFRLRNLRNKLSNAIDERLRYTPMGVFLEAMSVVVDSATK